MLKPIATFRRWLAITSLAVLVLSACTLGGIPGPAQSPSPSPSLPPIPSDTPTPAPSATPVPAAVIFMAAPGADEAQVSTLRGVVQGLASDSGLKMEERSGFAAGEMDPAWKVVVAVSPDASFADLAAAAPQTQFVAVGAKDLKASPNLTQIGGQVEQQAFLAGFMAAIATPDWRVGTLLRTDHAGDQAVVQAFLNGGRYLCGRCNPIAPPYPGYPLAVEIAGDADWQSGVNTLAQKGVTTVFLVPELQTPEILQAVVGAQMRFVSIAPDGVPEELRPRLLAGIRLDAAQALKDAWAGLISGKMGATASSAIVVTDVQAGLLTPGRMRQVDAVRQDLASGLIYPLNVEGK